MATIQDLGKVAYFNKGVYNSETTYEINDVVSYNGSSYVSLGNDNLGNLPTNTAFWSIVASKGDKGDTGKAFVIEKTYATIEDMVADYDNMNVNDYVMIQGSVESQENATLWTKTDTEVSPYKWVYLADFSGASGITGATPNIQIGTVTEGNEPSVTRRAGSTNENPILDFVLKTGATGATGATGNGISGVAKTSTSGLTDTYTISYTSGNSSTFDVHNGKGISSIAKTTSVGLVDTYTITYNDGTTSTFDITNGQDGEVTQEQLDETNAEVERVNMVYNALPKVSDEDTEFSLDNTAECPVYDIKLSPSELEQETTTGKNLLDINRELGQPSDTSYGNTAKRTFDITKIIKGLSSNNYYTPSYVTYSIENNNISVNTTSGGYGVSLPMILDENGTYTFSVNVSVLSNSMLRTSFYEEDGTFISFQQSSEQNEFITFTVPANAYYTLLHLIPVSNTNVTYSNIQLELGDTATSYEEYTGNQPSPNPDYPQDIHVVSGDNTITISNSDNTQSQSYPISLGDLEYCKTGDYEDVLFKNVVGSEYYGSTLELNKWYLKKNIGKAIFTGANNESWELNSSKQYCTQFISPVISDAKDETEYTKLSYTNYFTFKYGNPDDNTKNSYYWKFQRKLVIVIENTLASTVAELKTWLSSHNVVFYHRLTTPTYTLLNNTLQTQLDNLSNAISYIQQTNVSQTNNDLPFVIKMSAIRDLSGIFELIQE